MDKMMGLEEDLFKFKIKEQHLTGYLELSP